MVGTLVAMFIYKLRSYLSVTMGKIFQGQSYKYRQNLSDLISKIHDVFSLREQSGVLLQVVTKAFGCKQACLLFLEDGNEDFTTLFFEPQSEDNPMFNLRLSMNNPIVQYLKRERKSLTGGSLATLPEFCSLWEEDSGEIKSNVIELFVPLISRDQLIGILMLGEKQSGKYSLEDLNLLEDVTNQVAVSMEKEYLREQLREREEDLSVVNRSTAIITSNLDIQRIYDSFVEEMKKLVDVIWVAIVLIEEDDTYFLALSPESGSASMEGFPIKGTGTEWVATHKKTVVESDLSQESRFVTGESHLKQGIHTVAYLPLIGKGGYIGSLIMASCQPNAYNQRQIMLLEQLASQIAMPIENSRLYAKAEEKARIDDLSGLFNRRALDELMTSEIARYSRYGGVFSIIVLDLDSFKAYNDNYGHLAADKLLKEFSRIMKRAIRSSDQAFRYGGDEFAILLPQTTIEAAYVVAERVRKRIPLEIKASHIPITASLGLASWPIDGIRPNEIVAAADAALYDAKQSGGNQSRCVPSVIRR